MPVRPYQLVGSKFLRDTKRALLADDAGLGKTIMAIDAADRVYRDIVVVTTVSSLWNWKREFLRWSSHGYTPDQVQVIESTTTAIDLEACVHVIAHSQLSLVSPPFKALLDLPRKLVIIDEAQYLSNPGAKRTLAAYFGIHDKWMRNGDLKPLIDGAEYVYLLTATPAPNHYGELYPHLKVLVPERLAERGIKAQIDFLHRYCKLKAATHGSIPLVVGSRNVDDLRELMRGVVLRRKTEEVIKDMPPLTVDVLPLGQVQMNDAARDVLQHLREKLGDKPLDVSDLRRDEVRMSTERRALGLLKADPVAMYVQDQLEGGEPKIVLFAHHRDVCQRLFELLAAFQPVMVRGGDSAKDRNDRVDRFQVDASCRVFVGQIKAAGEAITLTAARRVVVAEPSWTPDENYQCIKRAHRLTQDNAVLAQLVTVDGTLDDQIGRVLARKLQMTADLFG